MNKLLLMMGILGLALLGFGGLRLLMAEQEAPVARIEDLAKQRSVRAAADSLSAQKIAQSDLPPLGTRSLFDHLIAQNGSLPYPFERVLSLLASYDTQGRRPNALLIPDGRSLLKGFADFSNPRIVVSADMLPPAGGAELPVDFRGRLFLGFVESAREIEVISYNELAGRFEFQLVENYCAGCTPRIVYAQRAICMTCHAGAAPIFPVRPWEETNVQPAIHGRIARQLNTAEYFSVPVALQLDSAEAFDNLTDIAGVIPTTQRIWLDGCGAGERGARCRRLMLELALRYAVGPGALEQAEDELRLLRDLQAAAWPAQGIPLANGDLGNRNPLDQALYDESFGAQLKQLLFPAAGPARSGDKLKDFDKLPALPPEFDPIQRREPKKWIGAQDLDGIYGLAQMFTPADVEWLDESSGFSDAALAQAIARLPAAFFDAQPLRRVPLLQALAGELGQPVPGYCCLDTKRMSAPVAQGEPPLELVAGSPLEPFERYCFACHRGNPAERLNFMAGASEAEVLTRIRETEAIREVLDFERYLGTRKSGSLMPPLDTWQRDALEQARAAGQDPLPDMRDQVPALFEF